MAAFAAAPIPYRRFGTTLTPPADSEQTANHEIAAMAQAVAADGVTPFPLLAAALPEIIQMRMPEARSDTINVPARRDDKPAPASEPDLSSVPVVRPSPTLIDTQPTKGVPMPTAHRIRPLNPRDTLNAQGRKTPLSGLFRILRGVTPPREGVAETPGGLQRILKSL
jgi:hypothetical protein